MYELFERKIFIIRILKLFDLLKHISTSLGWFEDLFSWMFWATIVDYLDEDSEDTHAFKTWESHNVTRPTDVDNPTVIKLILFAAVEHLKRFTEDLD